MYWKFTTRESDFHLHISFFHLHKFFLNLHMANSGTYKSPKDLCNFLIPTTEGTVVLPVAHFD